MTSTSGRAPRPRIGLSTYREPARWGAWAESAALLHTSYLDKVDDAGGVPVLLPPPGEMAAEDMAERAEAVVAGLEGVVVTGGADIDPAVYGRDRHAEAGEPQPVRDAWELALTRCILDRGTPALFICRGAQILNVAMGGSLEQHVPDRTGHRQHLVAPGRFSPMSVKVEPGSRLAGLVGAGSEVWCSHHQAIDRVAGGLEVVAVAPDGTVEAVEVAGGGFLIGVQWHPEEDDHRALFDGLVAAAKAKASTETATSGGSVGADEVGLSAERPGGTR